MSLQSKLFLLATSCALLLYTGSAAGRTLMSLGVNRIAIDKSELMQLPPALSGMQSILAARTALRKSADSKGSVAKFAGTAPPGQWDDVDGYFTFSQFYPEIGQVDLLLRGFPALRNGTSDDYRIDKWDRSLYWLEVTGQPPRLIQALELTANFVPQAGELFADNPDVVSTCMLGAGCTVNFVAYFRYRQQAAAPDTYENLGGAFVTDGNGIAIDFLVFTENAQGQVTGNERITAGDQIQLNLLGFRMNEPEYIYGFEYAPFVTVQPETTSIRRANYLPGVDFVDPELPTNLNAAGQEIRLVIDASSGAGGGYVGGGGARPGNYAYGGPYRLGFTWGEALDFLHRGNFERQLATPQLPPTTQIVKRHP